MSTKKILVYNTNGKSQVTIETDALNWGSLQRELSSKGISSSGMKAVVGKTKTNLEHKDAVIPDEDFTLFLFPEKTRSGAVYTPAQVEAMPFSEVMSAIKAVVSSSDKKDFDEHFNQGKNYTTKPTSERKALLISWYAKGSTKKASSKEAVAPAKAESKAPAKTAAKETTAEKPTRVTKTAVDSGQKAENTSAAPAPEFKNDDDKIMFIVGLINSLTKPTISQKNAALEAIADLKAGAEVKGNGKNFGSGTDTSELERQANEIRNGLSGIK